MPFRDHFGSRISSSENPPDRQVELFVEHLRVAGYQPETSRTRRRVAKAFVLWAGRRCLSVGECDESHVVAFLKRSGTRSKHCVVKERATVRLFLRHVRGQGGVRHTPLRFDSSSVDSIERRYLEYIRDERGLARNSSLVYMPYVRDFLTVLRSRKGSPDLRTLNAQRVQEFVLDRIQGRSSGWSKLLGAALRSFFQFLYIRGETSINLSPCVPMARKWRQVSVPHYLSPAEVAHVLSATSRSTARGRRDYAILLLLARLGLRAGEVILLGLDDIRWRSGEVVVRGKGGIADRLPLLRDVGEALAAYLRSGRHAGASRRLFLRSIPPHVGLTGPAAIGHIVRAAFARAGIRRTSRGAAHIFRHSLASGMIRRGASLAEIAEVLRHRSQDTTAIYAKVDFDALRTVARPWPWAGGAK